MEDTNLETFHNEADELLATIESIALVIEEKPDDSDAVNGLFRAVHTLKGSSGMFGFNAITSFSHGLESALDKVRSKELRITPELITLVLAYRDQVAKMLHAGDDTVVEQDKISDIARRLKAICPAGVANVAERLKAKEKRGETSFRIRFAPETGLFATGTNPALLLDELRSLGRGCVTCHIDAVPSLEAGDPEACYLAWDIVLTTSAGRNAIRDVFIFVEDICDIEITDISTEATLDPDAPHPKLGEILADRGDIASSDLQKHLDKQVKLGDLLVDSSAVSSSAVEAALSEQRTLAQQRVSAKNDSVRVPSDKLDALINLLGELVINQARLSQITRNASDLALAAPVEEADRLTNELRDVVLNIRMMPIGTTFSRFKRLVRDLSSTMGKQIDLVTEGAETELDKTVIDRLGDPLVHLIRNSVDHGIEIPQEREAAGKPTKGTITLAAAHVGANVVISVIDDGRGLNAEKILAKAKEKGLVAEGVELSQKEIFDLIFLPGFSTAKTVTDISGRGVGMDVVKREIDALRGTITVQSTPNDGTRIELSLPLTLAIIDGLLVHVAEETFVVPLSVIEGCLELAPDCFAVNSQRNLIVVRGDTVPLVRLRELFALGSSGDRLEQVVVVTVGATRVGVVVDEVVGNHQTVIKSLGRVYEHADCVSGATILGDGMVAMILDLPSIIRHAKRDELAMLARARTCQAA